MELKPLDEKAFKATFVEPVARVTDGGPIVDFWPYFEIIPVEDFEGHDCSAGDVGWVYRMSNRYEHVGVASTTPNVFMTIVLDLTNKSVHGHRLMNFNSRYGLDTPM